MLFGLLREELKRDISGFQAELITSVEVLNADYLNRG